MNVDSYVEYKEKEAVKLALHRYKKGWIKSHGKCIVICFILLGLLILRDIYVGYRLYKAQQYHIKTDKRVTRLEALHEQMD